MEKPRPHLTPYSFFQVATQLMLWLFGESLPIFSKRKTSVIPDLLVLRNFDRYPNSSSYISVCLRNSSRYLIAACKDICLPPWTESLKTVLILCLLRVRLTFQQQEKLDSLSTRSIWWWWIAGFSGWGLFILLLSIYWLIRRPDYFPYVRHCWQARHDYSCVHLLEYKHDTKAVVFIPSTQARPRVVERSSNLKKWITERAHATILKDTTWRRKVLIVLVCIIVFLIVILLL